MVGGPLVTIAMPVRNAAGTIRTAIRSIMQQTLSSWELLVIDDGSTDDSAWAARDLGDDRVAVLADGRREGLPARLNQAAAIGRGRYFARMDADDISYPERLER